jgi:hypothetical protein
VFTPERSSSTVAPRTVIEGPNTSFTKLDTTVIDDTLTVEQVVFGPFAHGNQGEVAVRGKLYVFEKNLLCTSSNLLYAEDGPALDLRPTSDPDGAAMRKTAQADRTAYTDGSQPRRHCGPTVSSGLRFVRAAAFWTRKLNVGGAYKRPYVGSGEAESVGAGRGGLKQGG